MHDLTSPASPASTASTRLVGAIGAIGPIDSIDSTGSIGSIGSIGSTGRYALGRRGPAARWQALTATQRRLLLFAALTAASGLFHAGVWLVSGMPSLVGPVTWRKPIVFGLSIAVLTVSLAWVAGLLPETRGLRRSSRAYIALLTMELALIDLQQWRGVGSHFNSATVLDTAIFAAMGLIIVGAAVITTIWTWHLFRAHPPAAHDTHARAAVLAASTRRDAGTPRTARPSHDSRALAWHRAVTATDAPLTNHDTRSHSSAQVPAGALAIVDAPAHASAAAVIGLGTRTRTGTGTGVDEGKGTGTTRTIGTASTAAATTRTTASAPATVTATATTTAADGGIHNRTRLDADAHTDAAADAAFAAHPSADASASRPAHLLAARAAMLLLLAGNLIGVLLARWGSAIVARTGVPPLDGPFADIKLAHAVALHGLQVLPLLVFAAARLFANEARTLRVTQIGVAGYAGLLLFSLARAAVATELAAAIAALALVLIDGLLTRHAPHASREAFPPQHHIFHAMSASSTVRS